MLEGKNMSFEKRLSIQISIFLSGILAISLTQNTYAETSPSIIYFQFEITNINNHINGLNKIDTTTPLNLKQNNNLFTLEYSINPKLNLIEKITGKSAFLNIKKNDISVKLETTLSTLIKNSGIYAKIGHDFFGKNHFYKKQNSTSITLGNYYNLPKKTKICVQLDYKKRIFTYLENPLSFTASINKNISQSYHFSAFAAFHNTQTRSFGVSLNGNF